MEYTELADYPVPSGRITEWVPTVVDDGSWSADDRPLSPNHRSHLEYSRTTSITKGEVGSWIGTAFVLPGAFVHAVFAATLRAWITRHDAFRTTARIPADTSIPLRHSVAADAVTIEARGSQQPATAESAYRHLEQYFDTTISAAHWPHVVAATIEPDNVMEAAQGTIVVVGADHSVMDAYSQLLLIAEIREIYAALSQGRGVELPPCASFVDHCATENDAGAAVTSDHPALGPWKSFWDDGSGRLAMPPFPLATQPDTSADHAEVAHQSSLSLWLLSAEETARFTASCKRHGRSLSTGAFTALAMAVHRLTGTRATRFVMPMHTRTTPESFASAGWYVGLVPVEIDLGGSAAFSDALSVIDAGVRRNTALAHVPYPPITQLLGMDCAPRFAVSFVDTRHLPGADSWGPADRALRSRARNADEVYLWINRTNEGMNISLRFPSNEVATTNVHSLVGELSGVMREVAAVGDLALPPVESAFGTTDTQAGDAVEPR